MKLSLPPLLRLLAVGATAIALAHFLDPLAYAHLCDRKSIDPFGHLPDWRMLLRMAGYAPVWILFAWIHWRTATPTEPIRQGFRNLFTRGASITRRFRESLDLALLPLLCVLVVELVKGLVRRRRPIDSGGAYEFIPWDGALSTSGMGFPSSHAAVAFTAAFVLMRLHPQLRVLFFLMGAGCALSRVAYRHHFLSDTVTSAVIAALVVHLLARRREPSA